MGNNQRSSIVYDAINRAATRLPEHEAQCVVNTMGAAALVHYFYEHRREQWVDATTLLACPVYTEIVHLLELYTHNNNNARCVTYRFDVGSDGADSNGRTYVNTLLERAMAASLTKRRPTDRGPSNGLRSAENTTSTVQRALPREELLGTYLSDDRASTKPVLLIQIIPRLWIVWDTRSLNIVVCISRTDAMRIDYEHMWSVIIYVQLFKTRTYAPVLGFNSVSQTAAADSEDHVSGPGLASTSYVHGETAIDMIRISSATFDDVLRTSGLYEPDVTRLRTGFDVYGNSTVSYPAAVDALNSYLCILDIDLSSY